MLQGVIRISDAYLAMFTTLLGTYFLPRFIEIRRSTDLRRELWRGLFVIVPAVAGISVLIYLLRDLILHIVFTAAFAPMRDLFGWQMVGNTLRMAGWVFGYMFLAKAHPAAMVVFEVSIALLWWLLSLVLIPVHGGVGATQAYAATYAVYLVVGVLGGQWELHRMRRAERGANG
jgi:O-antigen/teichoic acid export membrane protein